MSRRKTKKPRLDTTASSRTGDDTSNGSVVIIERPPAVTIDQLDDVLHNILGYFCMYDILQFRGVSQTWNKAATNTTVPPEHFEINSMDSYNAFRILASVLPNLQQISVTDLVKEDRHKYNDGEDPDEEVAASTADFVSHDIEILSNFSRLKILKFEYYPGLNGRYPFLFRSFPLLEHLTIAHCPDLKWDLEMLAAGMPLLKELFVFEGKNMTGKLSSLKILKDTLTRVDMIYCDHLEGDIIDLADFPHLKKLNLDGTNVTGDIRNIGEHQFTKLEDMILPETVVGGMGYNFDRVLDVLDFFSAIYANQRHILPLIQHYTWYLSKESPDAYRTYISNIYGPFHSPPFEICFVEGPEKEPAARLGWRWKCRIGNERNNAVSSCEINWLDPEPEVGSSKYEQYKNESSMVEGEINLYRGYNHPPTVGEYYQLARRYEARVYSMMLQQRRQRQQQSAEH
jgi:hypothetical protein